MSIKIILFGKLADIAKQNELILENIPNIETLKQHLHLLFPPFAEIGYLVSVNKKIEPQNTNLSDKDVVALMPPFSGG